MKRVLFIVIAAVAALAIGATSAAAAQPKTNAAAVNTTKRFVAESNKNQAVKLYQGFAPKQRKLFTQKQFVACFGPGLKKVKAEHFIKLLQVGTSVKTGVPGYRGTKLTNKHVVFVDDQLYGGKHHRSNEFLDEVYVHGAWHWWFTKAEISLCRGA